jgi:hypothetical protein
MPEAASRTFIVYHDPEAYEVIDLLLVTALDFSNGRTRRDGRTRGNGRKK